MTHDQAVLWLEHYTLRMIRAARCCTALLDWRCIALGMAPEGYELHLCRCCIIWQGRTLPCTGIRWMLQHAGCECVHAQLFDRLPC